MMKKGLFLFASMLFAAAIAVSCGNKNTEEEVNAEDSTAVEEATVTETNVEAAAPAVNKEEILSKAREAGRAKCNCYQTDPASVENCIKAILEQSYAAYKDDADFQAEMKAEFDRCVKEKATEAGKKAADEGVKKAAGAISDRLNNKK
ncbi:MAG: hypothetical protein IKN37_05380 [Bacteroidales bacterium]|nr:hypothetical protein [Bacteroidales bacterium]MCR5191366.1 hypothetical protein [Bacteroidales bacterium]